MSNYSYSNHYDYLGSKEQYFNTDANHEILTAAEVVDLIGRAQKGDQSSFQKMILMNQKLVIRVAIKYSRFSNSLEIMDLIQYGNLGLIEAIHRFDILKGFQFSTYAIFWIKKLILFNAVKFSSPISVSHQASNLMAKIGLASSELWKENGRQPTQEEVAEYLQVSVKHLANVWELTNGTPSLDQEVSGSGDRHHTTLGELIKDESFRDIESQIEDKELESEVGQALTKLDPVARKVIMLRIGYGGIEPKTLDEVGKILGKSRETIRGHETRAKTLLADYLQQSL